MPDITPRQPEIAKPVVVEIAQRAPLGSPPETEAYPRNDPPPNMNKWCARRVHKATLTRARVNPCQQPAAIGAAICGHCLERRGPGRTRDTRALEVTPDGHRAFTEVFGVDIEALMETRRQRPDLTESATRRRRPNRFKRLAIRASS